MLDEKTEVIRLSTAKEVMYGNKDTQKVFPIDVETRLTKYAVFIEKLAYYPELGEHVSLKTTRRFSQPSIEEWENVLRSGEYFKRYKGLSVTILHDPLEQQAIEGQVQTRSKKASTSNLRELVGKAKSASDFAAKKGSGQKGGAE